MNQLIQDLQAFWGSVSRKIPGNHSQPETIEMQGARFTQADIEHIILGLLEDIEDLRVENKALKETLNQIYTLSLPYHDRQQSTQ